MSLPDDLFNPLTPANPAAPASRKCRRHQWSHVYTMTDYPVVDGFATLHDGERVRSDADVVRVPTPTLGNACLRCGHVRDPATARRGRNNRSRGNRAELTAARAVGGRKVGPLGHPWDVEMPGYARLQVRKYLRPESLAKIAAELARIGSGAEMPGYIWVQPGRGGEQLIVFRLKDFAERHGIPEVRGSND